MVRAAEQDGQVRYLTESEAREHFDRYARYFMGISAQEFITRWYAGEYGENDDDPEATELAMLMPMIGLDPWANGEK